MNTNVGVTHKDFEVGKTSFKSKEEVMLDFDQFIIGFEHDPCGTKPHMI